MNRPPEASPGARARIARYVLPPSWVLLAAATLPFVVGFDAPPALLYAPFAVSLVFLGLPHGAADHLVPGWISGRGSSVRSVLGVALLYLALGSLVLTIWYVAPTIAFVFFILLTWFHWGSGDLYALKALVGARHLKDAAAESLTVFVRGGLPMLVPLLAFPETYGAVAEAALGLFGGGQDLGWVFGLPFRVSAGIAFFAGVVLYLYAGHHRAGKEGRSGWRVDVWETLLLASYFSLVPPVLAVGLYFCLWHSARHVARLMLLGRDSTAELERGRALRALGAFGRAAAPLTILALALLVALYFVVPGVGDAPLSLLALYLVLLSALTLPHAVVVGYADVREGFWRGVVRDRR